MKHELYISLVYKNLGGVISDQEFAQLNRETANSKELARLRSDIEAVWDDSGTIPNLVSKAETIGMAQSIVKGKKQATKTFRLLPYISGLAAVLLLVVFAVFTFKNNTKTFDKAGAILLADGTEVFLRSNSILEVEPINDQRIVKLKGEATFNVTKDRSRPFIVKTERADIEVLGTQFLVKEGSSGTQVYLIEGRVQTRDNKTQETTILSPAMSITYVNGDKIIDTLGKNNLTSWVDGVYEYDNIKLENVIRELSSVFDTEVVLTNDQMSDCVLSGLINANTLEEALDALVVRYKFSYIFRGGKVIINEGECK